MKLETLFYVFVFLLFSTTIESCSGGSNHVERQECVLDTNNTESFAFWSKSEYRRNPCLVAVVDHLYNMPDGDDSLRLWKDDCLSAILSYYDSHYDKDIPEDAKCDTVFKEIERLYTSGYGGTMDEIITSDACAMTHIFSEYYYYYSLYDSIPQSQKQILDQERAAWKDFEDLYYKTYDCVVSLKYWGGSICGPLRASCNCWLKQTRAEFIRYIARFNENSTYQDCLPIWMSKRDLKDCIKESIHKNPFYRQELEPTYYEMYEQCEREGHERLDSLYTSMDRWVECANKISVIYHDPVYESGIEACISKRILDMAESIYTR